MKRINAYFVFGILLPLCCLSCENSKEKLSNIILKGLTIQHQNLTPIDNPLSIKST